MTADKPDIDECIARAERDVDLAAGWLAADKDDADAQQNYQHCVAVRDFLRAHKRITESVSEQILQNQLAEADRRAAERNRHMGAVQAYIEDAEHLTRQLARETARADAWVKEVRDLARELGIADEDSNGSIHDWRHVKYKLRQLAELQAKHDALVKRLREPTPEMLKFLCDCDSDLMPGESLADAAMSAVALDKGGEE